MDLVPIDTHEPIKDRMYSSFSPNARFLTAMAESKMELLLEMEASWKKLHEAPGSDIC